MKRAAPLLADRLPVYADDASIRAALFGPRAGTPTIDSAWRSLTRDPKFPRMSPLFGGRHVPSVLRFFEDYEGHGSSSPPREMPVTDEERVSAWNAPKRRPARRA